MPPQPGRLYLIPSPIAEEDLKSISSEVIQVIHALDYFIVERARTARRYISATKPPKPIDHLTIEEMPESPEINAEVENQLKPLFLGKDMGLLSEAGLPAVADPGKLYVRLAHQLGIEVVPLSGPSSILMALMSSGLEGQRFMFHGYLTAKKDELGKALKDLESRADRDDATQIFMEAPYRNHQILEMVGKHVSSSRSFCIAAGIGNASGFVKTKTIGDWKKTGWPEIHKVPAVFLLR